LAQSRNTSFQLTASRCVGIPGEAELLYIVGGDAGQRTEALLTVGSAISQPIGGILVGSGDATGIHIGG